ncbi:MAG: carcinine hydrolase/isopenicillin-N N-acyltransferase family protein [Acidimicrobiales bacterium]
MCDLLCALPVATGGVTLFAKNSDRPPDEAQIIEWLAPRVDDGCTRATHVELAAHPDPTFGIVGSRPAWGWGLEHGVNEGGLAAGNATIYTTLDPRPASEGLTGMDLVRLVLERAGDADRAVSLLAELLATVGQGGSGHAEGHRPYWSSFLLADPRRAYVVETSGNVGAVEEVTAVRAISNRTTIPAFTDEVAHPRQPVGTLVQPRLDASRRVLDQRPVTVDALQAHLRSHDGGAGGWTVCMHVEEADHREATTSSIVAELPVDGPPVAHLLLGSPCRGTYRRVTVTSGAGAVEV